MKRLKLLLLTGILLASAATAGATSNVFAEAGSTSRTRSTDSGAMQIVEAGEEVSIEDIEKEDEVISVDPTFRTANTNGQAEIWAGKNLIIAGNTLTSNLEVPVGLMLAAGNNLSLTNESDYGFVFGNVINFSGETNRDLYMAGNFMTLKSDARIGRDVFVTGNSLNVETNLDGDLSFAGDTITINNVDIAGNVNLSVERIVFEGDVKIDGTLTYNDNAEVVGKDNVESGVVEVYEVVKIDDMALFVTAVYAKILSVAGLFVVMAIICAIFHGLHEKIEKEVDVNRFGRDLVIGLGVFIAVPIAALICLFTIIAAPLGIILAVLYGVAIYLSQGFAGAWLGHLILEKLCKVKANIFAESFIGILILGLVSLVPYLGFLTGFVGMLLGLGLVLAFVKPAKKKLAK